jgi:type IV pilus assembly protein PilM
MALHKKKLFDYFPLPKFLEMPAIGLDISDDAIRFVELIKKDGLVSLGRFGIRPLPPGFVQGGEILNKDEVISILKKLREELNIRFVHASLPEEKDYLYKTEAPRIDARAIREFVELRIEENVPLEARSSVFDYSVTESDSSNKSEHLDICVSVMPSKVISIYLDVLYGGGFTPLSLQTEAEILSRTVVKKEDRGTYLILNFGETKTGLSITSEGMPRFASTVQIGGNAITNAIAKHFSVEMYEAKRIKEEKGYVRNKANMELFFSLMNTISVIRDEVNKLMNYWRTKQENISGTPQAIDSIILCGRNAAIVGFDEYLSLSMKTPVRIADVWANVLSFEDSIPRIHFLDSLDYGVAVGLARTKTG